MWNGKTLLIKPSAIKAMAKDKGKRVGKDFLQLLNADVNRRLEAAIANHNGGRKTLDMEVAVLVGCKATMSGL
jgi:hypothetical protein